MNDNIFKVGFVCLWIIYVLIRRPFVKAYRYNRNKMARTTTNELVVLVSLTIGLLIIPLIWLFNPTSAYDLSLPVWLRMFGIVLAAFSLIYFFKIHQYLGLNWSPTLEINPAHKLITTGPYRRIRHPMYLQILLWSIAQALIISNVLAGFSGLISWIVLFLIRVPKEEQMLIAHFGKEYKDYMKNTNSIIPIMMK